MAMTKVNNQSLINQVCTLCQEAGKLIIEEQKLLDNELVRMSKLLKEATSDLSGCFSVMSDQLSRQKIKIRSSSIADNNTDVEYEIDTLLSTTSEINSVVVKAVISLQFEDIIQQLVQHSRQRIEKIDLMCRMLDTKISTLIDSDSTDTSSLLKMLEACQADLDKARKALDLNHPAQQQSMSKGDVTLF